VFADDFKEMHRQALEIKSWGSNVYVKIPITNSLGKSSIELIKTLSHQGVKLNVTALFTFEQVTETVRALTGGAPSIVSVFAGRVADTGRDPMPLMKASVELCKAADKNIELLWASSRELFNVVQADIAGCHIITCTADIIKKMSLLNKDLTDLSLETVQTFKADAESAGFQL
jgi:transaldolase